MENKATEKKVFPTNMLRICVEQFDEDVKGRVYTKLSEEPIRFENCCELLLKTDALFDRCGYPQTFQEKRDFNGKKVSSYYTPPKACLDDETLGSQKGQLATLDVFVRSRRNTSWQGIIKPEDGSSIIEFSSDIELLAGIKKLMEKE